MGGCLSSVVFISFFDTSKSSTSIKCDDDSKVTSSARVISVNGDLREYPTPFTVSQLLQSMAIRDEYSNTTSLDCNSSSSCFVCNSDSLYYDDYIPALDTHEFLQPNQIYFILPKTKLHYKLSASDMAALAVKATLALQNSSPATASTKYINSNKKTKTRRISPVVLHVEEETKSFLLRRSSNSKPLISSISRSGSIRKLQRYSSKRAKMAVRSFKLRLTTIYEGSAIL